MRLFIINIYICMPWKAFPSFFDYVSRMADGRLHDGEHIDFMFSLTFGLHG